MRSVVSRLFGGVLIAAVLTMYLPFASAAPAFAAASVQLSRYVAPQSGQVTVTGQGFTAGDTVTVSAYLRVSGGTRTVQATTPATSAGDFRTTFTVPGGTDEGTYAVTAQDQHSTSATRYLTVLPLVFMQVGGAVPTVTIIANQGFFVSGAGFAAGETVRIAGSFPLYNGNVETVSASRQTNGSGKFFEVLMRVPPQARAGNVPLTATGQRSGRRARATLAITYRPHISLASGTVSPGGTITVNAGGFVANSRVQVAVTIPRTDASTLTVSRAPTADATGAFRTSMRLPADTAPGTYSVTATDTAGGFRASTSVKVTAAPQPSPTSVAAPTPVPTSSGPPPRKNGFGFQYVSLWYHVVRMGTWDEVVVQGIPHVQLGIWAHVYFPDGRHHDYYEQTSGSGKWVKRFSVPRGTASKHSNQALVTFQLWHGKQTLKWFMPFTLV